MQGPKTMEEKLDDDTKKKSDLNILARKKTLEKLKLSGILVF